MFDTATGEYVRRYDGVMECAAALKANHGTITKKMAVNGTVGKYIVSSHRVPR